MSNNNKNFNDHEEDETPVIFPMGILLGTIGIIPLLYGLTQKQFNVTIVGSIIIFIGAVFTVIGFLKNRSKIKK